MSGAESFDQLVMSLRANTFVFSKRLGKRTHKIWKRGIFSAECHCGGCTIVASVLELDDLKVFGAWAGDVIPDNLEGRV